MTHTQPKVKLMHVIAGLNDGGAEATLFRLIESTANLQHVVVSMMDLGKYGPLLQAKGVDVYTLNMPRGRLTLRGILALVKIIKQIQPGVVQTWMYHADLVGGVVGRFLGVSVVWGIHNTVLEPGRSTRSTIWVAKVCAWLSAWVPNKIVCCANSAAKVHASLGYRANKMVVVPNGYDLNVFKPCATSRQALRAQWDIAPPTPVVGMVARFDPYKDHHNFLLALARLRQQGLNFEVVLVGAGIEESNAALKAMLDSTQCGPVRLLGQRADIPAVMNAIDLCVLASSAEAFPNVLAEAMACATLCVTTDVGDASHIVGSTGWVVPSQNPQALANAVSVALKECSELPTAWKKRKLKAQERVSQCFGIENMACGYTSVWRECGANE